MNRREVLGVLIATLVSRNVTSTANVFVESQAEEREAIVAWAKIPGRTLGELLERTLPDLTPEDREYLLWEETGFPCFFTGDPVTCLVGQLLDVRDYAINAERAAQAAGDG